jgi:HlyD family secretion protein
MKRVLSLVLVVIVVAAAVWGYLYAQSRGSAPKYRTARVERGPLTAAVSATGNLNAVILVQVGSQVSGQILVLNADFNTVVRKGQIIARLDPAMFQAQVNQAKAQLDAAKAAVNNQEAAVEKTRADLLNTQAALASAKAQTLKAQVSVVDGKRNLGRQGDLRRRNLTAQADLDAAQVAHDAAIAQYDATQAQEHAQVASVTSAEAQLKVVQAQLASARANVEQNVANLRQSEINLEHTVIMAPVDGVVVSRNIDVGQTVAASLQAPTLFTIAQDLTQMQVETAVDEADIGRIRVDGPATFTVDAFPGETFRGRVTQIRKAAVMTQNVVTYTVVVGVNNADGKLLPGMTANVKLAYAEKADVLKIPNAALRFRPPGVEGGPVGGGSGGPGGRGGAGAAALGGSRSPGEPGAAGREGSGGPGGRGGQSMEEIRDRLVKQLSLSQDQQAKLEPILQAGRERLRGLRELPEAERRARIQQNREETRKKIREILTPEQQAKYDESPRGGGAGGVEQPRTFTGRIYVVGGDGKPKAMTVTLGISDGSFTEVTAPDLTDGTEVIVGLSGPGGQRPSGSGQPRLKL